MSKSKSTYELIAARQSRAAKQFLSTPTEAPLTKSLQNETLVSVINSKWVEWTLSSVENVFGSNYVINRGVNLLAQQIAQVPLVIYRGDDPMDRDFILPGMFDIQNPHPDMSIYEVLYQGLIYYFYRGEFMVRVNRTIGTVLEPLNPKLMRWDNTKWVYNNKINIPVEELIYLQLFNPDNTSRGLSPVDVVKEEILNDYKAREYSSKFFEHFARVGAVLENGDMGISSDDMKALVDQFNQAHQNSSQAHKTLGLPPGVKINYPDQTMKDMDFAQGRLDVRDRILGVLGIHKSVFGATDSVDRAVADAAMRQLWIHTLKPTAIRLQEKINQHLMKRYFKPFQVYFDFSSIEELSDSADSVILRAKGLKELGYTMNEVNDYFDLGMDEVTDPIGSTRFVPSSMVPYDLMSFDDDYEDEGKSVKVGDKLDKIVELIDEPTKIEKKVRIYAINFNKLERSLERKIGGKVRKHLSEQLGKVMRVIKGTKSKAIDELLIYTALKELLESEGEALAALLTPVFRDGTLDASKLALNAINIKADPVINEKVVLDRVNKIRGINNTTFKLIRSQVSESIKAGETVDQLADRVKGVYKFASSRARTIARTESGYVINNTTDGTYRENGVQKKQWLGGTRESHAAQDGQIVNYNEPFDNGLMYPHDPSGPAEEVINCTCALAPIIE